MFITWTQKQQGITSKIPDTDLHYVLLDYDDINYDVLLHELWFIIDKYGLTNVVIMSDKERSYRIFSPNKVDFKTLLKIILDSNHFDYMFFVWTVRRGYATIRLGDKVNRKKNKIVDILQHDGRYKPDIDNFTFVEYETDIDKEVKLI